jgi:hypothetical protein
MFTFFFLKFDRARTQPRTYTSMAVTMPFPPYVPHTLGRLAFMAD